MIYLFFSGHSAGLIRSMNIDREITGYNCVYLPLYLHAGDISMPLSAKSRKEVYGKYPGIEVSGQVRKYKKMLRSDNSVCMMYRSDNADEYLGLLAAVDHLKNSRGTGHVIYLCDISGIYNCQGEASGEVISLPEKRLLSYEEESLLLKSLKRIQSENTGLRVMKEGRIVSLPDNCIDKRIADISGNREVRVNEMVYEILSREPLIGYIFVMARVRHLIKNNILIIKGGGAYSDNNEHIIRLTVTWGQSRDIQSAGIISN